MRLLRIVLIVVLLAILAAGLFLWLNVPKKVDLAEYAPADSLVYVEFNDLTDVARAIQHTDVWQATAPITQTKPANQNRLLTTAARAGLAPIESVLFTRTQIALVVVGLNSAEQDNTLKVRPEIALIAETHTTSWRTRPVMMDVVRRLANFAYGSSSCSAPKNDGDLFECSIAGGDRKLIGTIHGTEVILANSDNALRSCLDVRAGTRPSIRTDPEFLSSRSAVITQQSLGFGYISAANSAKLFSWAAPLLMGAAPGDQQLQQLLAVSAGKILRGIAWTALPARGGIEDRFLFSLDPGVVTRLQPAFRTDTRGDNFWTVVPGDFESLTIYRSSSVSEAWKALNSAVAFKLDALPAVLFGSLLKSSLAVYGIDDPTEEFYALTSPLVTLKLPAAEGSVLIAYITDEAKVVNSIERDLSKSNTVQIVHGWQADPDSRKEFMAVFVEDQMIIGKTENVRSFLLARRSSQAALMEQKKKMQDAARASTATIVTYANDEERLTNFISTFLMLQGRRLSGDELANLQSQLARASFAETETRLGSAGIERKTQSAFGQFSTFTTLLQANNAASAAR